MEAGLSLSLVDIPSRQIALTYGYSANQKIVKIMLCPRFRAVVPLDPVHGTVSPPDMSHPIEPFLQHVVRAVAVTTNVKCLACIEEIHPPAF